MALSRHHAASSKPLSIKELGSQAGQFDFSPNVALQRWIRAARMLLTEAALCEQDGNLQMAYLYLVRHADLVLERLPRHPDYRDPHFKQDISEAQRAVQKNFHKLDAWRPEIVRDYERYESAMDRRNAEKQRVQREREVTRQSADQSRRRSGAFDDDVDHLFDDGGRSLNAAYTFKSSATTEAGEPLRTVMLPTSLRPTFLNLAHPNTARNLETCGILCGTVIANALFINHLIIPDQQSSSDTCDTTPEGDAALFDFCDSKDLLVCGWIHTHPTQSCFLSSRDLHTSSGYQIMMPEAIAIVCAPRHTPEWGVFRLTAPPGLQAVLGCRQQGTFHPHAETDLYTDALRPGHVVEGKGLEFEVVDLRKAVN
ncbi:hypothetical protein B0A55_10973 [Friedmanniomyces simplex]|uniref:MPN domain-containing protein n=1 Tax=Friedmanniomyces simplex TaxID=329884 RepID=A0A4U0WIB7_9PEZI|nr:hypothetical protein B0A55_10973 [Friedmanniomyces simplex]